MRKWQEYQEDAAAHFRSLGLEAVTDERVEGVRGVHNVDVAVRSRRAGLEQLWLVECKLRRRRVEKSHVATLAEIVQDVGADRGILLSEVGFQAGAVRMAHKRNVTLTSLKELREDTAEELLMIRLGELRVRMARLRERLGAVGTVQRHGCGTSFMYRGAPGRWSITQLYAILSTAEIGLRQVELGTWPAPYGWDFDPDRCRVASDLATFVDNLTMTLDKSEAELAAVEAANA